MLKYKGRTSKQSMLFSIWAYAIHAPTIVKFMLQGKGTNNCMVTIWDCFCYHLEIFPRLSSLSSPTAPIEKVFRLDNVRLVGQTHC